MGIAKAETYNLDLLPDETLVDIIGNKQDALLGNLDITVDIFDCNLIDILAA